MLRKRRAPMTTTQLKRSMDRRFEQMLERYDETGRHFDVIAESLRDDLRLFADAIGTHTERLNQHETRIGRLEGRLPKA